MIKYICDECAKEEPANWYSIGKILEKPVGWLMKVDKNGETHACSVECVQKITEKEEKKSNLVVLR